MSEANINLVRSLYEAFARRDQLAVAAALDPEIEVRQTEQLPWGGYYKGFPDGVDSFFSKLRANVDSTVDLEQVWEAGDAVVALGHTRGQAKASGKSFSVRIVHIFMVRNGKIVSFEPYIDTPAMLKALE
jgi:uncharacterized protein